MIRESLNKLPKGPVAAEVKEIPPGEGCGRAEAPRGETFHYVRSDGGNRPVRHKIRAPSYVTDTDFVNIFSVETCRSCS